MVSQIHADKPLWTTSSKGLWGTRPASASITRWQRKGGVRTWVRARGRCPPLSWPPGCSQPVLLYVTWSEGEVYTSQAIPGARGMDSTLYSEVGLRGPCLWDQKLCQWGLYWRRLPGHCIPSTLPSGCPLVLLPPHWEDSVPSSSFHPFPESSTPPADLSSPQSGTLVLQKPCGFVPRLLSSEVSLSLSLILV